MRFMPDDEQSEEQTTILRRAKGIATHPSAIGGASGAVFIYSLSDPRTGEVRYVGKAFDVTRRFYGHLCDKTNTPKTAWIKSLKRQGLKPQIVVVQSFLNVLDEVWQNAERFWIESFRSSGCKLTNLDSGGIGGKRLSEETKAKMRGIKRTPEQIERLRARRYSDEVKANMSAAAKLRPKTNWQKYGLPQANKGKTFTEVHKARIGAARNGMCHSAEAKRKMSEARLGKKLSWETCRKMSRSKMGKPIPESNRLARLARRLRLANN